MFPDGLGHDFLYDLGHGVCDQVTRRCNCHTVWMENPISVSNGADYNCGNVSSINTQRILFLS